MNTWMKASLALNAVVCCGAFAVAAWAWMTHLHWQATDAYGHNSFPMNAFAADATWFAVIVLCVSAGVWSVIFLRRRNERRGGHG